MHYTYFDTWDTPSWNKGWQTSPDEKSFELEISIDLSGKVNNQESLEKIPDGTTTLTLQIKNVKSSNYKQVEDTKPLIPNSVTKLTIPSLPFPLSLIPSSVKYLTLLKQESFIKIFMVPPTVEYLCLVNSNHSHYLPNTIKELLIKVECLKKIKIHPTFTSPIHISCKSSLNYHSIDGEVCKYRPVINKNKNLSLDLDIQSITLIDDQVYHITFLPPTITSLIFKEFNYCLSQLQILPKLKYISLPSTYQQPIYQNQYLPINITHLELTVTIDKRNNHYITNDWLGKKGYLPQSITHIKIVLLKEDQERDVDLYSSSSPSPLKIVLPSSIKSICIDPDYKSHVSIIDKNDYYSITPTPPKIRKGLKELVLSDNFNQTIYHNTLPTTLQSLSILNLDYNKPLNNNNIPSTLTSLECKSVMIELDLSTHESIKELKAYGNTINHYPPNVESLELDHYYGFKKGYQFNFNKHLIKKLVIHSNKEYEDDLFDDFPNLQYLKTYLLKSKIPESVQELNAKNQSPYTIGEYFSSSIKETHFELDSDILRLISIPFDQRVKEKSSKFIPNQLPLIDNFFKIWRSVYLKPKILDSLQDSTRSLLRFDGDTGTLDHLDRFQNYNILVDDEDSLSPTLLKFNKADEISINAYRAPKVKLSEVIPTTIKKLNYLNTALGNIPNWITHLTIRHWDDLDKVGDIPPSVTNLIIRDTYGGDISYYHKIPSTVKYLTLDYLISDIVIPESITYLTLTHQSVNTLQQFNIPETIKKIEFKNLLLDLLDHKNFEIPLSLSSRLVNGSFYIYSNRMNKTTIPSNTTHLFWTDAHQAINNDDVNIPPSVHTLVLCFRFDSAVVSLPPTITQMVFNGNFHQTLESIYFPTSLKYLYLQDVSEPLEEHHFPNGLTHLVVVHGSRIISLPQSVSHLEIKSNAYKIPPQIKHVKLEVDERIAYIPPTIKSIIPSSSSRYYNIRFENPRKEIRKKSSPLYSDVKIHLHSNVSSVFNSFILPYTLGNNIKSISFGNQFDQVILKGTLPNSIEYLDFGHSFKQKLNKSLLPTSLLTLVLGKSFNQNLNNDLFPSSLTELCLKIDSKPSVKSSSDFPPNLKKLVIPSYDGVLEIIPTTVNHLEFNHNIVKDLDENLNDSIVFPIDLVQSHITKLVLNDKMLIQSYNLIPPSIKSIKLCNSITPFTKIPCTIESVVLPPSFNQPLESILQTDDDL
ncbi:hypothetical protein CYY_007877 [Polysphondylium violaceum]|uniref:FNIP repeat-containing protein n=1 Tax=Polysphondylium violaceum TaxID=133409 RepID=A0A8J4PP11_9MYCE|nr:hypothetical protein CYY_007877 [Polysphondylium violaceum]